ncbi:hypothetical protein AVEN_243295-1 [Araneus ventricosus]|uniref:RING-type domain-containing protein n=1 Tax=Araneus ventricosus TaxID=182803 RepID=A0A4Y2NB13_ARAVE|nr:hypothetical protein AVEN_243295-1 [Araneus ventricosus]
MKLRGLPLFLNRHFPFLREIFGGGIVAESARKRKHSQVASDERLASSVLIHTDPDTPRKRPRSGIVNDSHAIKQDASTSAEHLPPSESFYVGNSNRSPDVSAGTTAFSMVTGTDQDSQSAISKYHQYNVTSINREDQACISDNSTEFICSICLETFFEQDQIKRLRCSHVFHQSCIDMWLSENTNCPLCGSYYQRVKLHKNRRPPAMDPEQLRQIREQERLDRERQRVEEHILDLLFRGTRPIYQRLPFV